MTRATKNNIQLDTILVDCYGYNMTLYKFFKVIKITDKSVKLQQLEPCMVQEVGFLQFEVKPTNKEVKEKPFIKRFNQYGEVNDYLTIYDNTREYIENHAD